MNAYDSIVYSILWCFQWILNATEQEVRDLVDMYNANQLSSNWRFALEAIDGCDGPGDAVVAQYIHGNGWGNNLRNKTMS